MIVLKLNQDNVKRIKDRLATAIAKRQMLVANNVLELIVEADVNYAEGPNSTLPLRTPYWSGAYQASWRIKSGSIDPNDYEEQPRPKSGKGTRKEPSFTFPRLIYENQALKTHSDYKLPIYIQNFVDSSWGLGGRYSRKVEDKGTPLHEEAWKLGNAAIYFTKVFFKDNDEMLRSKVSRLSTDINDDFDIPYGSGVGKQSTGDDVPF